MTLDIRLLIPGLSFAASNPFARSLGGSETAGLQVAAAMVRAKHTVTVFANVDGPGAWQGVNMAPASAFNDTQRGVPSDLAIVQRAPMAYGARAASKVNFLWVHDLLFARRKQELLGCLHQIDRIVTVSDWQKQQYQSVAVELTDDLFLVSRNGIDLGLIEEARAKGIAREPNLIMCAARPERGVDVLLSAIFPNILERLPNARLALCAYDCPNPQLEPFYQQMVEAAARFGDKVEMHGALTKVQLYELMHRASLYLYPTPSPGDPSFADTSCIAAMEAMACGLPVLTSFRGALPETIGTAGSLLDFQGRHAASPEAIEAFTKRALLLLDWDSDAWNDLQRAGLKRSAGLGWDEVAAQMVDEARRIMRDQCADPVRLTRHFIRQQDIEAARVTVQAALEPPPEGEEPAFKIDDFQREDMEQLNVWLQTRFAHTADSSQLAAYYATKVGPNNDHVFQGLMRAPDARFRETPFTRFDFIDRAIRRLLELAPDDLLVPADPQLRILDFGCSQGECPIVLSNRLGAAVLGVDASWSEVDRARKLAEAKALRPDDLTFEVADEGITGLAAISQYAARHGKFDVLVAAEVMEHVIDPVALLERLAAFIRPGGAVILTMPYGGWETQQPEKLRGQHLREWHIGDFRDVFGKKRGLIMDRAPLATCPVTGEILGNSIISYIADDKALGRIDWKRKLTHQRPRQTLSACMILGGASAHETLHWCLKPVMEVADELIVADCGITEETRRILDQYGAKIVPGANPLEVGFEVPRNLALEACRGDWVLMIDGDEKLLSPQTLWPYLRENTYHTYALPQHHFAVDAAWRPDLPGRLFRRRPDAEGRSLRFIGKLHEHAEFAPNAGAGRAVVLNNVRLAHVGYLEQQIRAGRFVRNLPLLQADLQAYPDRKLGLLVLCRDSMIQAKWLTLMSGRDPMQPGVAMNDAQIANLCRDVVGVWERAFMDDTSMMAGEAQEHYHEACRMLGTDILADGALAVQRQGVGQQVTPGAFHFASIDHFERYMAARLKQSTEQLRGAGF